MEGERNCDFIKTGAMEQIRKEKRQEQGKGNESNVFNFIDINTMFLN